MHLPAVLLTAAVVLLPSLAFSNPILAELRFRSEGTATGPAPSNVPFFLAYYPLIDPTSLETIMLQAFVPNGFEGARRFLSPQINPVVARLLDHIEERLGSSTIGLIGFPPENGFNWGSDAIRDTWQVHSIVLRVFRAELTDRFTDFDYRIDHAWRIIGTGQQAPSAVPEPGFLAFIGLSAVAFKRCVRIKRRRGQ